MTDPAWLDQGIPGVTANLETHGVGVAVADFTGDGRVDVFLPNYGPSQLMVQQPSGSWANESIERLPTTMSGIDGGEEATSASAADYDGDGDLDIFVGQMGPDRLLRNEDGFFEDVTAEAGLPGDSAYSPSSAWGDYDGDGDLDLLVASHAAAEDLTMEVLKEGALPPGPRNRLYRNEGDGTFVDATELLPTADNNGYTYAIAWVDLDEDGDLDIYAVRDFGPIAAPNVVFVNEGSSFRVESSLFLDYSTFGMGLGIGDMSGDLLPDFLVATWDSPILAESGGGAWFESDQARQMAPANASSSRTGWGGNLADFDNDGLMDAFVSYGALSTEGDGFTAGALADELGLSSPAEQPDALFHQGLDGTFMDVASAWGVADLGRNRGAVETDINGDGWLDLVTRSTDTPAAMYLATCGAGQWIEIDLDMPGQNRNAIGAKVIVEVDGHDYVRWVGAGGMSLGSSGPSTVHFGLGDASSVDRLEVLWPDGAVTVDEYLSPNQRIRVARSTTRN